MQLFINYLRTIKHNVTPWFRSWPHELVGGQSGISIYIITVTLHERCSVSNQQQLDCLSHDRLIFIMEVPIPGKTVFILRWDSVSPHIGPIIRTRFPRHDLIMCNQSRFPARAHDWWKNDWWIHDRFMLSILIKTCDYSLLIFAPLNMTLGDRVRFRYSSSKYKIAKYFSQEVM